MLIVQDLGLRYIWIDSLCIIQDDVDDLYHELAKMSSIYTNSYITIAATQSDGGMRGCYLSGSLYHQDHRLPWKQQDATMMETDLYVREKIAHIGEQGAVTPLLKRGWVCQERLLSPRVLHFCERELVWECQEASSCQCSCFDPPIRFKERYSKIFHHSRPIEYNATMVAMNDVSISDAAHPIPDTTLPEGTNRVQGLDDDGNESYRITEYTQAGTTELGTETINIGNLSTNMTCATDPVPGSSVHVRYPTALPTKSRASERPSRFPFGFGSDSESEYISGPRLDDAIISKWRHIISDYSGMDLTKKSDRLPAIVGVASQFGDILNIRYLAGLWQTALPGDLLWRTDHTIESGQHRSDYRTPSWSWASVDGKIKHYKLRSYRADFWIAGALCNPITDINPFGEVTNRWLKVYARTANLGFTLNLSEDKAQTRRRLKVEFLGDSTIFIPEYDISEGLLQGTPVHTGPTVWNISFFVSETLMSSGMMRPQVKPAVRYRFLCHSSSTVSMEACMSEFVSWSTLVEGK